MGRANREILTGGKRYKEKKLKNRVAEVVFDKENRKNYLTGFHKRKLERKKKAQEYLEEQAKKDRLEERARIREERKAVVQQKLAEIEAAKELNPFLNSESEDCDSEEDCDNVDEEENDADGNGKKGEGVKFHGEWGGFEKDDQNNDTEETEKKSKKSGHAKGILKKQIYEIDNQDAPVTGTSEVTIESLENPNSITVDITKKMNVDLSKADEVLNSSIAKAKKYAKLMGLSETPVETEKIKKPKKKKFRYLSKTERKVNNLKIKQKQQKRRNKDRE